MRCERPSAKRRAASSRTRDRMILAATVVRELMARTPEVNPDEVEDLIIGCATPEAQQGMNMARQVGLLAGLPVTTSAMTINRFCSSGLQAIAIAAEHVMCGFSEVAIGGGAESMSLLPMGGHNLSPNPTLVDSYPDIYLNMGLTAENVARKYEITREQQDEFAVRSHQRAGAAIDAGKFKDEIVPVTVVMRELDTAASGRTAKTRLKVDESAFDTDEGVRRDTSIEALAKLRPVFHAKGTVTAGNILADLGRRCGGTGDVARAGGSAGSQTDGAICRVRNGRSAAGGDGHRPGRSRSRRH